MINPIAEIETELNNIAWHLQVAKENELPPDPSIVLRHLRLASVALEELDHRFIITSCHE